MSIKMLIIISIIISSIMLWIYEYMNIRIVLDYELCIYIDNIYIF